MALYHFTAKAVSFGKGQSAVHTAAYNARTQLAHDRESRVTKNYADKGGLEFSGIFAPPGAPAWTQDREAVWNRAEAAERQANGQQPARNVEFALPHELDAEQRRRLVTDFAREAFGRKGMIADIAIHAPHGQNDERNFHVHCLLTMRKLDGDDFAKTKERAWNTKAELAAWKEKWAEMGARALERAGFATEAARFRHGHQTLPKQREAALERGDLDFAAGLDREATIHKGPAVSAMESRDDPRLATNQIFQEARGIAERNQARAEIRLSEQELAAARGEAAADRRAATVRSFRQSALVLARRPGLVRCTLGSSPPRHEQRLNRQAKQDALRAPQRAARAGLAGYHPFMARRPGTGPASPLLPWSRPLKRASHGAAQASYAAPPASAHASPSRVAKKTARRRRLASSVTTPPLQPWRFVPVGLPGEAERPARPLPPPARGSGSMGAEQLSDYIAACEGRISWAQYHRKWGGGLGLR